MSAPSSSTAASHRDRRRSLKTILHLPLFPGPRQPALAPLSSATGPDSSASVSLPEDILREIAQELSQSDILNVSLASSHIRNLLIPELYRTVHLKSSRSCKSALAMLVRKPELSQHIQKLAVRPNYYLSWPNRDVHLPEAWVAQVISRIARKKGLKQLRTFDWDGLEMPEDDLWRTLRNSCPELKEVFSNVGFQPLNPNSELFQFSDLTNFSLSVRHGLGESDIFPTHEPLPPALWTMLLHRCPALTELTLCSFSASHRLFDLAPLASASWPSLSSLTLGAFGYASDFTIAAPPAAPFAAFLAAHPGLTYLRLAWNFKRWMSPDDPADLGLVFEFPEGLEAFSGVMQQLPSTPPSSLPLTPTSLSLTPSLPLPLTTPTLNININTTLTTLDLMCEPLYASRADRLCAALRLLPSLTGLELWVHIPEPNAGHEGFFRELWGAATGLEDLHFMCTTGFGKKPLAELARSLDVLPNLRTFALTKGHRYADESMRRSAVRIFGAVAAGARAREVASAANSNWTWVGSGSTLTLPSPAPSIHGADTTTPPSLTPPTTTTTLTPTPQTSSRLTQINIRWARASCRNHLKQEGTYERISASMPCPPAASSSATSSQIKRRGTFGGKGAGKAALDRCGEEEGLGEAATIDAWERGLRAVGGAFDRRYQFVLAPPPPPSSSASG
ncbi:F-box domain-containing protein [Favolaschia claudopus]|uniref:F-box domain-containing protein n=1 Tax=Favolaschia claudopus TaxID=2862362 RepID=A0AAW0CS44_9AGAR